ncbi:MAG: transposase [Janthinobacterium lividum]
MPTFPSEFQAVIYPYARLFCRRVFAHVQLLLLGAILAPGKRTVTSVLRIISLGQQPAWHKYHRVLSRARWSARAASRVLLAQLVAAFLPAGPLIFGLDETLERRWGPRIAARGIYRDAVLNSKAQLVKGSGLRWLSVCLLTPLPWATRIWALPVLTVLAPSAKWTTGQGRRHKKVTDWAWQIVKQLARWLPGRPFICLGDSGYAVLSLLAASRAQTTWLTRLRLDAAATTTRWQSLTLPADARGQARPVEVATSTALWYSAGSGVPIRWVLVRAVGIPAAPLSAFLSTDLTLDATFIGTTYAQRWALEATFAQVQAHLGVESQRQWTDLAIARTTPRLLSLFSLVPLLAARLHTRGLLRAQTCAWYQKAAPTFRDALAAVRHYLWTETTFDNSSSDTVLLKIPRH